MINKQTVLRLIEGIQSIISESRSSLSVREIEILTESVTFLETVRDIDDIHNHDSINIVANVVKILLQVLLDHDLDKIKDLLF